MFYNNCHSSYILISNFATSLGAAMVKAVIRRENLGSEAEFAWEMA